MASSYISNVEVALWRGDQWLLIRRGEGEAHAAGTLALIGGKTEPDDAGDGVFEATVRREVKEEVGLDLSATPLHYVTSAHFVTDAGVDVLNVVFCGPAPDAEPVVQDPDEVAAVLWLPRARLEAHGAPEWTRRYIALADEIRCARAHR